MTQIGVKKQAIAVLTSILFAPSYSHAVDMGDLVSREYKYYEKFQTKPYTGEVLHRFGGWDASGQMVDGVRVGSWVSFYENGQLEWKGSYLNGCKDGNWFYYYSSGQLRLQNEFRSCKNYGEFFYYFENGRLSQRGEYKDGLKHGSWVSYHKDFSLARKGEYKNDKKVGDWVAFYKDGTAIDDSTGFFVNGIKTEQSVAPSSPNRNIETDVEVDEQDCMLKFLPVLRHFC